MNGPPAIPTALDELPKDPCERHEFLVEVFGRYLKWAFDGAISESKTLVENADARRPLGRIRAGTYAQIAETFSEEQRNLAYEFSQQTLEAFAKALMGVLTAQGISHRLGNKHVIQFRLILDICETENLQPILEETLNRGGTKAFYEYLNRWLHQKQMGNR